MPEDNIPQQPRSQPPAPPAAPPSGNLPATGSNLPAMLDEHAEKAAKRGWAYAPLDNFEPPPEVLALLDSKTARRYNAIPVGTKDKSVWVAVEDPDDFSLRNTLVPMFAGRTVRFMYADPAAIKRRIDIVYSAAAEASEIARHHKSNGRVNEGGDLGRVESRDESDNIALLRLVIEQALREDASDVHFEPIERGLDIRFRIDGKLRSIGVYPRNKSIELATIIKVDAGMRSDNFMIPDSGVYIFKQPGKKDVDIRVETAPTAWGTSVVMRLQQNIWRPMSTLGFSEANMKRFHAAIEQPFGVILATGPTGSGKAVSLCATIPTPSGNTTMGALREGDLVFGRDGRRCRVVTLWPINQTPDLCRVQFSDGQEILADRDHQWLVSSHHSRNVPRTKKRMRAIDTFEQAQTDADALDALADSWNGAEESTATELLAILREHGLNGRNRGYRNSAYAIAESLAHVECPRRDSSRTRNTSTKPVVRQRKVTARARWLAASAGCVEIGTWFGVGNWLAAETVKRLGTYGQGRVAFQDEVYEAERISDVQNVVYPTAIALKSLALRLRQQYAQRPSAEAGLSRMTTGEMLSAGLRLGTGHARFAVPVAAALDLPAVALPVDPYVLGAWLGDGGKGTGSMTGLDNEMWQHFEVAGYPMCHSASEPKSHYALGLVGRLRSAGVLTNKHIPISYLRASAEQRLALLQGLMDTDGTIDAAGACELSLSDKRLATGALNLIRSLGIKASVSWNVPASDRDENGHLVECKDRHRIHFTTDKPIFRLPRKARRVPTSVRLTQGWLYITGIEPVLPGDPDYGPARCITVDSPDHTYLCGDGYVVTSNTTTLYASLNERIDPETKIITLENPIEYKAPSGISQMAMNDEQGMHFASGLRSILRQDPDVILVGEIRDAETAETAVDAAMTGHLVFSTLHTNNAPGAIPRLARMGIEPLMLADSLLCVLGQRLVSRLCNSCKTPMPVDKAEIAGWGFDPDRVPDRMFVAREGGCVDCGGKGWAGRVPIHEVMLLSAEMTEAIAAEAQQSVIARLAREAGMTSMREDGFDKALEGLTTVSEVNKSTRRSLA